MNDALRRRVQAAFASAPRSERLHVAGRLRSCPLDVIDAATPRQGRVLDFGCGHGAVTLYLAMAAPDRRMTGVDVDVDKLVHGRAAAARAGVTVEFDAVPTDHRPSGEWDGIVIVDVLYLLGEAAAMDVIDHAAQSLVPGGVVVVKEIDLEPRWKYMVARAQEALATKVLRITEGRTIQFVAPSAVGDRLRTNGLEVTHVSAHRGRLHPHHLVTGRKPA